MTSGNFFFDDGKSRKFWSYTLLGQKQTIHYGRIGTKGNETTKTFPSASAAEAATSKLVSQKIGKGYIQVDPSRVKFHADKKDKKLATKAQVASLEKRIQAKLPAEYKDFLLTRNGVVTEGGYITFQGKSSERRVGVGEIYGLFDEPNGFSLLWGLEKIQPRLPKGHLPIAGWLDYYSLSLEGDAGCIYLWDEMAAPCKEFDERGKKIFNAAHGVLVAGSFNEFLTRIALYQDREETNEPQADSTPVDDPGTASKKQPEQKSNDFIRKQLVGRDKSRLSQRRQFEILRLTYEGGDELTAAIAQGEKAYAKHRRQIYREITDFLKTTTNKDELHFFADNWHWEASGKPVLQLIKNPHVDAGTLLQIFWYGCPEDYYQFDRHESEIDDDAERVVFQALRQIERRIVKGEYKTAAIPFDPSKWISMWERRSEFARPIPDVMYQPILGGKPRKG